MNDEERTKYRNGEKAAEGAARQPSDVVHRRTSVGLGLGAELHKYGLNSFGHKVGQVFPFKHLDVSSACVEARTLACADWTTCCGWRSPSPFSSSPHRGRGGHGLLLNWLWPKDDKPFIGLWTTL